MAAPGARLGCRRQAQGTGRVMLLAAAVFCVLQGFPGLAPCSPVLGPGLAMADAGGEAPAFLAKVVGAAAQGATAATVAALLSAVAEPVVNRLLVKRMTVSAAYNEVTFKLVSNFFLTTFPTNMLKFPVFEVINMAMSFAPIAGGLRGVVSGWLFCTVMLPVTNYRFRKSMGWEVNPALLYQAYIPTVARDIIYGWARGLVGDALGEAVAPSSPFGKSAVFGLTIWAACIISSPGNEWRGYTLQPKDRTLPFAEYFKPINYLRSTGIGATIMGIALMVGMLVSPYAEEFVGYLREHAMVGVGLLAAVVVVIAALPKK